MNLGNLRDIPFLLSVNEDPAKYVGDNVKSATFNSKTSLGVKKMSTFFSLNLT